MNKFGLSAALAFVMVVTACGNSLANTPITAVPSALVGK
jgi:hypothetical protein